MRTVFLALSLLLTTSFVRAAPCTEKTPPNSPCTPAPNTATNHAKLNIVKFIKAAQSAEPLVEGLRAAYVAVRDNPQSSTQDKLDALNPYRDAKMGQDDLYHQAIEQTSDLYHVKPDDQGRITIGEPDEQDKKYMKGLRAIWDPQVTDSGPTVKLAIKINGSDKLAHYSGATEMNPFDPNGRQAITTLDGRVFILKDTFELAVRQNNLGFLAHTLYHETRHFNRLSWTDAAGKNRSWATTDEEERDAYEADAAMGKVFGLKKKQIDDLKGQYQAYANAVKSGVPITDDHLTPNQEATWKNHYDYLQINLDAEYAALQQSVADEKAGQLAAQKRELEERQERARANAERIRVEKERARAELTAEAARCGFELRIRSREDDTAIGFKGLDSLHQFGRDTGRPPRTQDLRIIFLIARACDAVKHNYNQDTCNDSAQSLNGRVSSVEFNTELNHMFGLTAGPDRFNNAGAPSACIEYILANAGSVTDSRSFESVVAKYQKKVIKDEQEDRERRRSNRVERPPRSEGGSNRQGSGGDSDYIWDPGCGCWARRQ